MSAELAAVWPSDAPRKALTWQTHEDMLCRYLTAMRTRDCSFYVQLAMPSAQRRCLVRAIQTLTTMTTPKLRMTIHSIRMNDDTSDDAGTPTIVSADAAAVLTFARCVSWHRVIHASRWCRFCESCANEVHNQGRGCPLCRTPINMLLRLY